MTLIKILLTFLLLVLTNCASITADSNQPISLVVRDDKEKTLEDVKCTVVNDKGAWDVKAPGFVNITRSAEDITVTCKKNGYPDGLAKAISRARGNMWGNIIFGGGIGAFIDHSKGTGYAYSDQMTVIMGRTILYDRESGSAPRISQ
jgi:hypothetical protein